jgi:hypothetical protein
MPSEFPVVLALLASVVLMASSMLAHPERVTCPHGWWLPNGARGGLVVCRPVPTGDATPSARGFLVDVGIDPPGEIRARLACDGERVRQDGVSAWCAP